MQRFDTPPRTDAYIPTGRIDAITLAHGCYSFADALALAAEDLTQRGEAAAVLAELKGRAFTVRQFLRDRYGIFTGPREYWHPGHRSPDSADARSLRWALRAAARSAAQRKRAAAPRKRGTRRKPRRRAALGFAPSPAQPQSNPAPPVPTAALG